MSSLKFGFLHPDWTAQNSAKTTHKITHQKIFPSGVESGPGHHIQEYQRISDKSKPVNTTGFFLRNSRMNQVLSGVEPKHTNRIRNTTGCVGLKDYSMALPWLLALKVIPWGDVIEHAPKIIHAARKLMKRQTPNTATSVNSATPRDVTGEPPSMEELTKRLMAAQVQLDEQALTQHDLAQTLAEMAEQNARLVTAVDALRLRTRLLLWVSAALISSVLYLLFSR